MRILICSLELSPFVTVGGLAEAVAGLCRALAALGHRISVALPRRTVEITPPSWLEVVTMDIPGFEEGDPYGPEIDVSGTTFERLALLAEAILALCRARAATGQGFDVMHIHDWPMAFLPYVLRFQKHGFEPPRTVLTLHNARSLGLFPPTIVERLGLAREHARHWTAYEGLVSTLVAGVRTADAVTTVSPSYARQLSSLDFGQALQAAVATRESPPLGILNGIDTDSWNPATDPDLAARFDANTLGRRTRCKVALLEGLGVSDTVDRPLIVSAARMYLEKGTDVLAASIPRLVELGCQLVIAGAGAAGYEELIREFVARAPGRRALYMGHAEAPLMHELMAAADLVLIPSRYEACGLVQMYAQRYGAVPVAHSTGGLLDTIVDEGESPNGGTGFLFAPARVDSLLGAVQRALRAMGTPAWGELQRRCMRLDRDWSPSARQYEHVYRDVRSCVEV